ncbi:MAG: hypothetical protein ABI855_14190 [Bacteroidota bacterium]
MKKLIIAFIAIGTWQIATAQSAKDIVSASDVKISWLGIDLSHIKLIGNFSQMKDAGQTSPSEIRGTYFPAWNGLIINEQKKYDLRGMLRKDNILFEVDQMNEKNSKTSLDGMEASNPPGYKEEDIAKFVKEYKLDGKTGIGIAFIAESFNKGMEQATIHFVAINNATKEILIYEKITAKPAGFGIRNYWAGAIRGVMQNIEKTYYKQWKSKYGGK